MNKRSDKHLTIRTRHITIILSLILIVASVGWGTLVLSGSIVMMNLSKNAMAAVEQSTPASSLPNPSSAAVTAATAVSSQSSLPSANLSSVPSKPTLSSSSSKVSSTPKPMDPAIYQAMYPNLYVDKVEAAPADKDKVVYLTFDDGPSNLTIPLLNVLDQYKVKATFFLIGKTDPQSLKDMKEIVDRGNVVGVHSYTHQYKTIYATPAAFLDDFAKMHDLLLKTTGVDTHIYRYAGGSENSYNHDTAKAIISEMNRRGYTYYDWNVSSGDAERGATARSIYTDTINGVHAHSHSVVLFHNTNFKGDTLSQMPKIIQTLQKEGYRFATLDPSVDNKPYIFRVY